MFTGSSLLEQKRYAENLESIESKLRKKTIFVPTIDEDVKAKYKAFEHFGKIGLVDKIDEYEIYALTWDDIFTSFDLRHSFMLDKLKFNRDELVKKISDDEKNRETVNDLASKIV